MSKETKQKNPNITTEAFKLNKEIPLEKEIREFLDRSNNKSGLIKDALSMYMHVVNVQGYASPYLQNNVGDWGAIFSNLNNNVNVDNLIGRPAEQVKQEVINNAVAPTQTFSNQIQGHEHIALNMNEDDYDYDYEDEDEENDDFDTEY